MASIVLLGTGCQRGLSLESARELLGGGEEEPFAVSPPDSVRQADTVLLIELTHLLFLTGKQSGNRSCLGMRKDKD